MKKVMNYSEVREIIPVEMYEKYMLNIEGGYLEVKMPDTYMNLYIGAGVSYSETDTVVRIQTDQAFLTLWKDVQHVCYYMRPE